MGLSGNQEDLLKLDEIIEWTNECPIFDVYYLIELYEALERGCKLARKDREFINSALKRVRRSGQPIAPPK